MLNKYIIHPESGVYFFGGGESPTQTPFYFCEKFVLLKCFVSLTSKPESTMFFLPKSNFAKSRLSQQHLKNISQNGNRPQIGMKIDNVWNHLVYAYTLIHQKQIFSVLKKQHETNHLQLWCLVDQNGPESPASCWCSARCWTPSGPIEVVVFLWHQKMDSIRGKVGPK